MSRPSSGLVLLLTVLQLESLLVTDEPCEGGWLVEMLPRAPLTIHSSERLCITPCEPGAGRQWCVVRDPDHDVSLRYEFWTHGQVREKKNTPACVPNAIPIIPLHRFCVTYTQDGVSAPHPQPACPSNCAGCGSLCAATGLGCRRCGDTLRQHYRRGHPTHQQQQQPLTTLHVRPSIPRSHC